MVLLIAVLSGAAGHALAQPFENTLGRWLVLLCALTSARVRQLLLASDGQAGLAELVDSALTEVAAGVLEFEHVGRRRLSALPVEAA